MRFLRAWLRAALPVALLAWACPVDAQTYNNPPPYASAIVTVPAGTTVTTTLVNSRQPSNDIIVHATGNITTWNIKLPINPYDGQLVTEACPGGSVTTVSTTSTDGSTVQSGGLLTCVAGMGQQAQYQYSAASNTWLLFSDIGSAGTLPYADSNVVQSWNNNVNNYTQVLNSNSNAGTAASADFIVSNNLGTASTYYGDFGINSSGWVGTGGFNLASETYLYAANGDLALGTSTANSVHIVNNGSNTDTATFTTALVTSVSPFATTASLSIGATPKLLVSATAPTFTSGACVGAIGTTTSTEGFTFTTGSGSCTAAAVIGMPTAATGWICFANDIQAAGAFQIQQTADSTTSITLVPYSIGTTPAAVNYTASHTIRVHCTAY